MNARTLAHRGSTGLCRARRLAQGMTLMELMAVVAILGILAAIAIPNYTEYVRRGYRADARGMMTEAAQVLERFRSVNGRYNQDVGGNAFALPAALRTSPRDSTRVRYNVSIVANSLTVNSYLLQAVPVDATDACGSYTLDQAGTRLNTVGANPAAYLQNCWER
ncbi:type IV pilin protein [Cupriavidus pinatubonensis]|uniref:Uncharacterized protein n=1 Tax=Cupriavidus pinatubonensis TaxID=248026 RepID=A0ABM8XYF1_9BURK|nr:type IV pilin protein [Cupriavidus pinatubonensis]CAG9185403.1 hypothetical protein LMG23994_05716 [Cupriavidus pinatubonensis]